MNLILNSTFQVVSTAALDLAVDTELNVKYFGRDPNTGAIILSRKVVELATIGATTALRKSAKR